MLKLTYTELGLHLEQVATSLEQVIAQRSILAVRYGHTLHIEPGRASFLLPAPTPGLTCLELALRRETNHPISITTVDEGFVEVSLQGSWIAAAADAHEGMFLTCLSDRAEFLVYKLWQDSQAQVSQVSG